MKKYKTSENDQSHGSFFLRVGGLGKCAISRYTIKSLPQIRKKKFLWLVIIACKIMFKGLILNLFALIEIVYTGNLVKCEQSNIKKRFYVSNSITNIVRDLIDL